MDTPSDPDESNKPGERVKPGERIKSEGTATKFKRWARAWRSEWSLHLEKGSNHWKTVWYPELNRWAEKWKHRLPAHKWSKLNRRTKWIAAFITILILIVIIRFIMIHWTNAKKAHKVQSPVLVVTAPVKQGDIPVYISGLGSVTPYDSVTIRTQINGQLLRVLFEEGQMVKEGDLLAEIDPRPYEAQLIQYQGQLERDQAYLDNARIDLERYKTLWGQDSVSEQTLATQDALVRQYEGIVKYDEGQIETVKINLIYCRIISPVNGRVGLRLVDPGNFVQTTDSNGLVVVNTLQPMTVIFTIPEDNIPEVVQQINTGKTLSVDAYDRAQIKLLAKGKLVSYDNQIDPTTGTIKLRAEFANENNILFPSQFVNANLLVDTLKGVILIPTAAIQYGNSGSFVFVPNKKDSVDVVPVKVLETRGEITAIKAKILPGQSVVVEGTDKLTEGSRIKIADNSTNGNNVDPKPKSANQNNSDMPKNKSVAGNINIFKKPQFIAIIRNRSL